MGNVIQRLTHRGGEFRLTQVNEATSSGKPTITVTEDQTNTSQDDDLEPNGVTGYVSTRRNGVSAETYDPEEDDDKDEKVVHPKSDSQRKSLFEAVKDIFLRVGV